MTVEIIRDVLGWCTVVNYLIPKLSDLYLLKSLKTHLKGNSNLL
jgi:hypothetical protein